MRSSFGQRLGVTGVLALIGASAVMALAAGCEVGAGGGEEGVATSRAELVCTTLVDPLTAVDDASLVFDPLDPTRASSNFGATQALWLGVAGTAQRSSLLRFDVSSIPAASVVHSATLSLVKTQSVGGAVLTANDVLGAWTEGSVTYNSFGGAYAQLPLASVDLAPQPVGGVVTLDLTSLATRWVAGGANEGVLLDLVGGGRGVLASSEVGNPALRPQLTVCVTLPPPTCSDGYANASETDVDCGGPTCGPCGPGLSCAAASDCTSLVCTGGVCAAPTCSDGVLNQNETATDCGGACYVAEVCNGLDEDCNGVADDGNPGGGLFCNTGELGVCAAGTTLCQSAAVACIRDQGPTAEACNAVDDDCDGLVDEGCAGLTAWSQLLGGSGTDGGRGVATDAAGNVYSVGFFAGTTTFGATPVTAAGSSDGYLVKTDAAGNFLWSKQWGGGGPDVANGVIVDGAGNIYVTGWFQQTVNFGGASLTSAGSSDMFLLKLDAAGNHLWSKKFGSTSQYDQGYSLGLDAAGNVLLAGSFGGTVNFGGGSLVTTGNGDAFVAKFDPNGTYQWVQRWGGTLFDFAQKVSVGPGGQVVTCGHFMNTAKFGGVNVTSAGSYDLFVVVLDASGNTLWSKQVGNPLIQFAYGCDFAPNGNVLVTGGAQGDVNFGGGTLVGDPTNYDVFLAELTGAGQLVSGALFGQDGVDEIAYGLDVSPANEVFFTGQFSGAIDFGAGVLNAVGGSDAFAVRLDPARVPVFSRGFGTTASDLGLGLAVAPSGAMLVTGYVTGTADFGAGPLTSNGGSQDTFLLSLTP